MNASWDTFVFERAVVFEIQMLHAGLQTQGTLLQLAKLLVAHRHIVEDLESNELVPRTPTEVDNIEHTMRLLQ